MEKTKKKGKKQPKTTANSKTDLIRTIEETDDVNNLSEESDLEIEVSKKKWCAFLKIL